MGLDSHPKNRIELDIGVIIMIKNIQLKNGQNTNDRSSQDIGLYTANCPHVFKRIITDTLTSAINVACEDIPVMNYTIQEYGRYVRFVAYNYYGSSPALQYLHVDYDYPSGVFDGPIACPGKNKNYLQN